MGTSESRTRVFFVFAALCCASAVLLGAFGAHGLKAILSESALKTYNTGVEYQFYHGLALLIVCSQKKRNNVMPLFYPSALLFSVGIILFSGSLYLLAWGAPRWFGMLTPLGGLSFVAAWLLFAYSLFSEK